MHLRNHMCIPSIVGILVAAFLTGEALAQDNTDWETRFFAEAPKCWEGYLRFVSSLQITAMTKEYKPDRSIVGTRRKEFKQKNGASLLVVHSEEVPPKGLPVRLLARVKGVVAEGINPFYSFKLERRGSNTEWVITDLDLPDQPTAFNEKQKKIQEEHLRMISDGLRLESLWLPTLIKDPDFIIKTIKTQVIDGLRVIRLDFDYSNKGSVWTKGGWMVLDPEHDWIIREYVVHHGQPEKLYLHQVIQIQEGTNHHPIVTRKTWRTFFRKKEKQNKDEKQFGIGEIEETQQEVVERSEPPLEEFTLSAFGLPEPPGIQVAGSRLHLWIALAGIVCISIAVLIRWQLRRTRTVG